MANPSRAGTRAVMGSKPPRPLGAAVEHRVNLAEAMIRITHVITSTSAGGAQMMLYKLLSTMDRGVFDVRVVSLTDVGPVGERIAALGVPVQGLRMARGVPDPLAILRLAACLRRYPATWCRRGCTIPTWWAAWPP